jgi:hypothetical protein
MVCREDGWELRDKMVSESWENGLQISQFVNASVIPIYLAYDARCCNEGQWAPSGKPCTGAKREPNSRADSTSQNHLSSHWAPISQYVGRAQIPNKRLWLFLPYECITPMYILIVAISALRYHSYKVKGRCLYKITRGRNMCDTVPNEIRL